MEHGCSERSGHPHICLCIQRESGVSIGAHPEIDALAEAHIHVAQDGLTLRVAFSSLYEHVGNRNLRLQTRDILLLLLLLLLLPLLV